jgi:hypothetical protein
MVSVIFTARERYGLTERSVRSVLRGLPPKVPVVFVAGKAPPAALDFLRHQARRSRRFTLVERDRYLLANEARNLGLGKVPRRSDVVFIENDVVARDGWLSTLLRCAREEKADIVAPLVLEGDPSRDGLPVHIAGANQPGGAGAHGPRDVEFVHLLNHEDRRGKRLRRTEVEMVEFHCLFIRRQLLDRVGLDGRFGAFFSHLDLCFAARKQGARILVEPKSQVVFANPALVPLSNVEDFDFFTHQWREQAARRKTAAFGAKWGLDPRGPLLWGYRRWSLWNRAVVWSAAGSLSPWSRTFWRMARWRGFPEGLRERLEGHLVQKVRKGFFKGTS